MARFLILQLARFGDLVQTGRLLRSLLTRGEAHLCVDRSLKDLAELLYPGVPVHGIHAHAGGQNPAQIFTRTRKALGGLTSEDFDEVYNLNYSGLSLALTTLFDPAQVRGHVLMAGQPLKDHWAELAFRWTRRREASPINLVDYWAWLDARGMPAVAGKDVNPKAEPRGGGLGVVLAGRHSRRSLPPQVLALLVQTLVRSRGMKKVYLLGGAAEHAAARELRKHASPAVSSMFEDLTGKTDWKRLMDAVSGLDLVLTPDTGTMHLAAHLGVPVLACFLSSAWAFETGPYGEGHSVLQAVTECAPCIESQPCHNNMDCLEPFTARETLRLLAGAEPRSLPGELALLEPRFDELGQWCAPVVGQDPHAQRRAAQRAYVAAYFGLESTSGDMGKAVDALCIERDWMTKNRKPGAIHE